MPRGRLSSPRFRRRLAWSSVAVGLGVGGVVGAVVLGDTGRPVATRLSTREAWTYREPPAHRLTTAELRELQRTTSLFIRTAVERRDLDRAWELASPALRGGLTRREWLSGDNTVVPFPVDRISAWNVDYAYENDVAFDVSLYAEPPYDTIGKTFMIELKRAPRTHRWLVDYWAPKGVSSLEVSRSYRRTPPSAFAAERPPLPWRWLLVAAAFAGVAGLLAVLVAIRSALRSRRRARRFAAELAAYRSSSSPS